MRLIQCIAARSLGLTHGQTLRQVVIPQGIRKVVPALMNDFVAMQKDVGLISVLGAVDAVRAAQIGVANTYNFTPYVVAALLFVAMSFPMIRLTDLTKRYGSFTAVNGIALEVPKGELFGFLGPNGAGKTTTLRMIAGILQPTAGTIEVAGHDIQKDPVAAKARVGFIPDRPYVYEKLTGAEFMRFVAGLYETAAGVMHVSPGLGTTFVPFRFFARPEVTELVLRRGAG